MYISAEQAPDSSYTLFEAASSSLPLLMSDSCTARPAKFLSLMSVKPPSRDLFLNNCNLGSNDVGLLRDVL